MKEVVLSQKAKADLLRIYSYLAEHNVPAAERLIEEIDRRFVQLARFPFLGRERNTLLSGLRSVVVGTHLILYLTNEVQIRVVRIIDGRMDIDEEFQR